MNNALGGAAPEVLLAVPFQCLTGFGDEAGGEFGPGGQVGDKIVGQIHERVSSCGHERATAGLGGLGPA